MYVTLCSLVGLHTHSEPGKGATILTGRKFSLRSKWFLCIDLYNAIYIDSAIFRPQFERVNSMLLLKRCAGSFTSTEGMIGIIFQAPVSVEGTESAVRRIGSIKTTFFGSMWEFSDDLNHSDTAYTKEGLEGHTDNTYFTESAGSVIIKSNYPRTRDLIKFQIAGSSLLTPQRRGR